MTDHALHTRDRDATIAEDVAHHCGFGVIVRARAGAVRVDEVDVA